MTLTKLASLSLFLLLALALSGCGALVAGRVERAETSAETRFPPGGQIIDVDGVPIHAVVMGKGPDLVIIHGANGNTRDWTFNFAQQISDKYRVIVFDRPGFGHSGRVDPDYAKSFSSRVETLEEQAAVLSAAAAKLGATKPIVVGHSYGGAVGLTWALNHPLAALVPVAAVSNTWEGEVWGLYRVAATPVGGAGFVPWLTAFIGEDYVANRLDDYFAPNPVPEGYGTYVGAPLTLRRQTLRANARQIVALKAQVADMVPRYPGITVPVEIIHGDADTDVPLSVHSAKLAEQVPEANLTVLPGIGHMLHHAAPRDLEAAIDRAATRAGLR